MGTPAIRISASDFVTPPELARYRLAADGAGRIGGVRIELNATPDGTRLGQCYQQVPLRVVPAFQFGPDQPALLYLLNPTAGLMDGDAQLVELTAGPGSRAVVVGQSATRIHPSVHGFATQQWTVRVDAGAVLVVMPGPAIPFRRSRYYQRVAIDLAEDAGLIWADLWLAGRYARGEASEQFQFNTFIQDMTVRRRGALVFRDRFCWRGPWDRETAAWHFGDAPACASLFVTGTVAASLFSALAAPEWALFTTAAGDTCLRCAGPVEKITSEAVRIALHLAALRADEAAPQPWLLATHALGPNHWFSPIQGGNGGTEAASPTRVVRERET